jgi:hypothetical protein
MLKKLLPKIGIGLCFIFLVACEQEEEPELPNYTQSMEITVDGQTYIEKGYINANTQRSKGFFESEISGQFYDAANTQFKVYVNLKRAKSLVPGTYKLPSDSITASVSGSGKGWHTGKNNPLSLTITEFKPNPMAAAFQGHPETIISGSFSFVADSIPNGNSATGSKTVSATFKDLPLVVYNEVPNFSGTINQKPWTGDALTEYGTGQDFYLRAYNHWGDLIYIHSSQKVVEVGSYPVTNATYQKRMPNGSFQTWALSNPSTSNSITIEKSRDPDNYPTNFVTGNINFTATPVAGTGATGTITVNAAFTELYLSK